MLLYGKLWRKQKDLYIARNEAGLYTERSAEILKTKNYGKDTDAYKSYSVGKLPPAHIHAMARRYAVKLFLAHLHHIMHVRILEPSRRCPIRSQSSDTRTTFRRPHHDQLFCH